MDIGRRIYLRDLPRNEKNGTFDKEKMSIICQIPVESIEFYIDSQDNRVLYSINRHDFNATEIFIESMYRWIKKRKMMERPKEVEPIHSPFTANLCPKCKANLGGKLIDDCYFENPYYSKCPNCGTPLKKLDWQKG